MTSATGGAASTTGGASSTTGGASSTTGGASSTIGGASTGGAVSTGGASSTTGGAGGNLGGGGMSSMGGRPSGPSLGCTKNAPNEALGMGVMHMLDVTGMADAYLPGYTHRLYCTIMPKTYDPAKPYPVVFYGPGCGAKTCEGVGSFGGRTDVFMVQAIASLDATIANKTIVPKNGSPGCFQAGKEGSADSPEGPYFDQVMAQVEDNYCIDKGKVFAAGTSSGAWLSNYLACARGNVVRGTAADSGGLQFAHGTCTGGAAVMEFPGDSTLTKDQEGNEIGSGAARDLFIKLNGCSTTPTTMMFGKASCQVYGGCDSPVAWCNVGGTHQSGQGYLGPSGLPFWTTLK